MPIGKKWLTPAEAARAMSERAGYIITPDDIRQLRRTKRLRLFQKLSSQMTLYDAEEIRTVAPPKKRNPTPYPEKQEAA